MCNGKVEAVIREDYRIRLAMNSEQRANQSQQRARFSLLSWNDKIDSYRFQGMIRGEGKPSSWRDPWRDSRWRSLVQRLPAGLWLTITRCDDMPIPNP